MFNREKEVKVDADFNKEFYKRYVSREEEAVHEYEDEYDDTYDDGTQVAEATEEDPLFKYAPKTTKMKFIIS